MIGLETDLQPIVLTEEGTGQKLCYRRIDRNLIISENHRRKGTAWSGGGPFYQITDRKVPEPSQKISGRNTAFGLKFTGRFAPLGVPLTPPVFRTNPDWDTDSAAALAYGATAFNRARPGNPTADALNTGVELLRDGIPAIPLALFNRLRPLKSVGSEYLNVQFGWLPLLRDIQKMYETYRNLDRLLSQLRRDNGKGIRRRRVLVRNTSVSTVESASTNAFTFVTPTPWFNGLGTSWSRKVVSTVTQERVWFAARFRYYIPDIGTPQWTRRATRALFGLNPTPAVIWNALPWSWLIDWFSNVGDVMSNLSVNAAENCVADYAFLMREYTTYVRTEVYGGHSGLSNNGSSVAPFTFSCAYDDQVTRKTRVVADPYGFGMSWNGLSPYQLSILAALGVSRK